MIKLFKIYFLLVISFFILINKSNGQDIELGMFGGTSYYNGELNPGKQFYFCRPAFGGLLRWNFDTRWSMKFNIYRGELAGDDAVSKVNEFRNLRFESSIVELSTVLEFNFLDYFTGSSKNYFTPFLFVGPGFFSSTLQRDGLTTSSTSRGFAGVFGFGFKYSVNSKLGLGLEWGMRKTFTDYIDNIGGYYPLSGTDNPNYIDPSPTKHVPGMQSGDPANNDWYSFAGITLTYRFTVGEKSTCSDFEYSDNK